MTERPLIPDLDPRADAHVIGKMTLSGLLILLAGVAVIALIILLIVPIFLGELAALFITFVLSAAWGVWIMTGGPANWMRHRHWRERHELTENPPGLPLTIPAGQAHDPVWSAGGATWGVARLTLPPTGLIDAEQLRGWHQSLAQAVRVSSAHGLIVDIRTAQLPGSTVVPPVTTDPVMTARWRWWVQTMGPRSAATEVYLRMGWPDPRRDPAWVHFQSVEQAWRAVPGPGDWQWLSASSAQEMTRDAANPAAAYSQWVQAVLAHLPPEPGVIALHHTKGGKRRVMPR